MHHMNRIILWISKWHDLRSYPLNWLVNAFSFNQIQNRIFILCIILSSWFCSLLIVKQQLWIINRDSHLLHVSANKHSFDYESCVVRKPLWHWSNWLVRRTKQYLNIYVKKGLLNRIFLYLAEESSFGTHASG